MWFLENSSVKFEFLITKILQFQNKLKQFEIIQNSAS